MKTETQIQEMWVNRQNSADPTKNRARIVRDIYDGSFAIPSAELDDTEMPATVNLINQGINGNGMRIASGLPDPRYFALRPGIKISEERARDRRIATLAWWDKNRMNLKLRRRARHLVAYGMTATIVTPDPQGDWPRWDVRDPLNAYPSHLAFDEPVPDDCIFATSTTAGRVRSIHGDDAWFAMKGMNPELMPDDIVTLLEYLDDQEVSRWVTGWRSARDRHASWVQESSTQEPFTVKIGYIENRTGKPLAVIGQGIGLDRSMGQMEGLIGTYQKAAQIDALQMIGVKKGIYPETWLVSRPGEAGRIVKMAEPLQGRIGVVEGGDIREISNQPEYTVGAFVDRYERNQRVQGGIPPEFGGEAATGVKTGRRGEQILSAAIDFPIQEAQEVLQESLHAENVIAIAIEKEYFPGEKTIQSSATKGKMTYIPAQLWETDEHKVRYSYAGVDQSKLLTDMGQRYGMEAVSKRTLQEVDPLIEDPEFENDRIQFEQLERIMFQAMNARAAADPMFVDFLPDIAEAVLADKDSAMNAYKKVSTGIKEMQAAMAQGAAAAQGPEAQPGLADPSMPPSVPPVGEGSQNLTSLLQGIQTGARTAAPTFGEGGNTP